jgi:DNA-binding MarR family transcriptional regulator
MAKPLPMQGERSVVDHIAAGLGKVAVALRSQAWEGGTARGLTPTQGQILVLLSERGGAGMRLNEVAQALCITAATASDAVASLAEKSLLAKQRSVDDHRALVIRLTAAGRREAASTAGWIDVVKTGVRSLTPEEQAVFLRGLTKVIRSLQDQGVISVARMCASCTYFQPYVHADTSKPHHCGFVDRPMGDAHLRIDCAEFVPGSYAEGARRWDVFVSGSGGQ